MLLTAPSKGSLSRAEQRAAPLASAQWKEADSFSLAEVVSTGSSKELMFQHHVAETRGDSLSIRKVSRAQWQLELPLAPGSHKRSQCEALLVHARVTATPSVGGARWGLPPTLPSSNKTEEQHEAGLTAPCSLHS